MAKSVTVLEVGKQKIEVTNIGKVLYPEAGFTKGDVIDYYIQIAPVLLPHIQKRALTLKRYPNGVSGPFFYEKNCPAHRPPWVKTTEVWNEGKAQMMDYCLANDLPTLVWAANLADLEIHTSLARSNQPARPTALVFDLDPGPPADIAACCDVALVLRKMLAADGLECFPKTSGSKGLQILAPLNTKAGFEQTKIYAHELAQKLERELPETVVSNRERKLRRGKVLVDWSQNSEHKTTVAVYSLRGKSQPTVSTPLRWDEVEACAKKRDAAKLVFLPDQVSKRVARHGDLFEPLLSLRQKLPKPWLNRGGTLAV